MAATWHLSEFLRLLIRCLCPTAEFPLIFTQSWFSHFPFSFPPFSLFFLKHHGKSRVQNQSDHTLYFRDPATCHYSWFHISKTRDMHWEEDREDPGGAEFKAIRCSDWDHDRDFWTAFQGNYRAHVFACAYVLSVMSHEDEGVKWGWGVGGGTPWFGATWICLNIPLNFWCKYLNMFFILLHVLSEPSCTTQASLRFYNPKSG